MQLEFNEEQQLILLHALHVNYMNMKLFFKENNISKDDTGLIVPKQYADLYNVILQKAHEKGNLQILSLIRYK